MTPAEPDAGREGRKKGGEVGRGRREEREGKREGERDILL